MDLFDFELGQPEPSKERTVASLCGSAKKPIKNRLQVVDEGNASEDDEGTLILTSFSISHTSSSTPM